MLAEFLRTRALEPGEQIFCFVPESGRFTVAYALFEVERPSSRCVAAPVRDAQPAVPATADGQAIAAPHDPAARARPAPGAPAAATGRGLARLPLARLAHAAGARITRAALRRSTDYLQLDGMLDSAGARGQPLDARRRRLACGQPLRGLAALIETHAGEEQYDFMHPVRRLPQGGRQRCRHRRAAPQPRRRSAERLPARPGRHAEPGRPAGRDLRHRGHGPAHRAGAAAAAARRSLQLPPEALRFLELPRRTTTRTTSRAGCARSSCVLQADASGRADADIVDTARHTAAALPDAVRARDALHAHEDDCPTSSSTQHDPRDPSPWLALYLDQSTPLLGRDQAGLAGRFGSRSRQFLLPIVRPLARTCIVLFQLVKAVLPPSVGRRSRAPAPAAGRGPEAPGLARRRTG